MKIGEYCKRTVVSIASSPDAADAAKLMRTEHVGFLIVYREGDELRKPVGVLTDRDLVLGVLARDVDPHSVTVDDVMTRQPLVANDSDELGDLLQAMRLAGIRRVPVVDVRGALIGIMAIDDAIDVITGLMCDLAGSLKSEQRQERRARAG
ncbi:MAG TPA: CBS domain-containing protein [Steroidobacteraceae bacterium]|jgi:predicted transcriptional regulator|nr:CBS domain-containing protein [Steroidobacteraceae bacterium]